MKKDYSGTIVLSGGKLFILGHSGFPSAGSICALLGTGPSVDKEAEAGATESFPQSKSQPWSIKSIREFIHVQAREIGIPVLSASEYRKAPQNKIGNYRMKELNLVFSTQV
ncbi:uncharacterized protein [Ambystoma mexicanum]